MPKYKQPDNSIPESLETAWRNYGEIGVCKASIIKYAKVLDMTDSGRDIKPLVTGMMEVIDRLKALEAKDSEAKAETPLFRILNGTDD